MVRVALVSSMIMLSRASFRIRFIGFVHMAVLIQTTFRDEQVVLTSDSKLRIYIKSRNSFVPRNMKMHSSKHIVPDQEPRKYQVWPYMTQISMSR